MNIITNNIIISDINDYSYNFNKLLNMKNTIIVKKCNNIDLTINNKINKIIVENCKNIKINLYGAIIGIEVNKSIIDIILKKHINCLEAYKSTIYINKKSKKTTYILEDCTIKYF
jgi:hypothetical protein